MSSKDNDLENLLKPLKDLKPNEKQLRSWKNSIPDRESRHLKYLKLLAAMLIGFVLGAAVFKNAGPAKATFATISSADATFEYSHSNLD